MIYPEKSLEQRKLSLGGDKKNQDYRELFSTPSDLKNIKTEIRTKLKG